MKRRVGQVVLSKSKGTPLARPREIDLDEIRKSRGSTLDVRGPTLERLGKAADAVDVGDDRQGTRIYFMRDTPLQRFYGRLKSRAGTRESDELTREYTALMKYRHHWYHAGLEASVGSVDLNRVFSSDPSNMSGMAKSERQFFHRQAHRAAREVIGHEAGIVVDNFCCYEWPMDVACASSFRGRRIVREAASKLAREWGIG